MRLFYADINGDGTLQPTTEILDERNYYPFGLQHRGYNDQIIGPKNNYQTFNGKELEEELGLDWYDFGARRYDATVARWLGVDPLAGKMPSWSPYTFNFNNPLRFVDPLGLAPDDWVLRNGSIVFDPNVTSANDSDLNGAKYLWKSNSVSDGRGNITRYRSDGSIFYENETAAYNRMVNRSKATGNETFGALTKRGILVLPSYKSKKHTYTLTDYGYSTQNGNVVDASGKIFNTLGTAHTHPRGGGPSTYNGRGYLDAGFAGFNTPYKPVYVFRMGGENAINFIMASPKLSRKNPAIIFYMTNNYPSANLSNLLKGQFSLIQYTINNGKAFRNAFK